MKNQIYNRASKGNGTSVKLTGKQMRRARHQKRLEGQAIIDLKGANEKIEHDMRAMVMGFFF